MKNVIAAIILLCGCLLYADTQISWKELQNNMDSWIQGPVSLIVTAEEKDFWGKLKSPEEKMQFIKIFWARRDPILRTRENEFKEEFFKRVDYAIRAGRPRAARSTSFLVPHQESTTKPSKSLRALHYSGFTTNLHQNGSLQMKR
jgi:hypothetical protein